MIFCGSGPEFCEGDAGEYGMPAFLASIRSGGKSSVIQLRPLKVPVLRYSPRAQCRINPTMPLRCNMAFRSPRLAHSPSSKSACSGSIWRVTATRLLFRDRAAATADSESSAGFFLCERVAAGGAGGEHLAGRFVRAGFIATALSAHQERSRVAPDSPHASGESNRTPPRQKRDESQWLH